MCLVLPSYLLAGCEPCVHDLQATGWLLLTETDVASQAHVLYSASLRMFRCICGNKTFIALLINLIYFAFLVAPLEIEARGERAQLVYQRALRDGAVNVQRSRILFIGQDRAGKTSLKKSLIGLPFDSKENSTEGIEVDPSIFRVDVNEVKNWQPTGKSERGLLGCSKDVAQMVVGKLCSHNWVREDKEKRNGGNLKNDNYKNGKEVGDANGEKEEDSRVDQVCL